MFYRIWFKIQTRFRHNHTYLWLDPRDGEWTVTHKGQDYSDLAALHHDDPEVKILGEVACALGAPIVKRDFRTTEATESLISFIH